MSPPSDHVLQKIDRGIEWLGFLSILSLRFTEPKSRGAELFERELWRVSVRRRSLDNGD